MKKNLLALLALAVIVLILYPIIYKPRQTAPQIDQAAGLPAVTENSNVAIVKTNFSPSLVRYSFMGKLVSMTETGAGTELKLDTYDVETPQFIMTPDTRIHRQTAVRNFVDSSPADLSAGSQVDFHLDYEKNGKFWIFRDIYILNER